MFTAGDCFVFFDVGCSSDCAISERRSMDKVDEERSGKNVVGFTMVTRSNGDRYLEMFFSPTSDPNKPGSRSTPNDEARLSQGATNQSVNVKYSVRFFSARPVRRALVRLMELQNNPPAEVVQKLHNFADVKATDSIIVTLTVQSERSTG